MPSGFLGLSDPTWNFSLEMWPVKLKLSNLTNHNRNIITHSGVLRYNSLMCEVVIE